MSENNLIHTEVRTCPECAKEASLNVIIRHYNNFLYISYQCIACDKSNTITL